MIKRIINKLASKYRSKYIQRVSLDCILRGAEGDNLTGLEYVQMTGDKFRTSTRAIDSPQVKLLEQYHEVGERIFEDEYFCKTDYYKNALEAIYYVGDYFPEARKPEDIIQVAKRFIYSYHCRDISQFSNIGHNSFDEPIIVRPIKKSKCFQLVSGNHRVASYYMKGMSEINAIILENEPTKSYFTDLLEKVIWDEGIALYQPLNLPEISHLPLIRKCEDRFLKMINYLNNERFDYCKASLLDVGSYYGWFVKKFIDYGVNAFGLEKDFSACVVAKEFYNLEEQRFINMPIEKFIVSDNTDTQYDIVLFLSVMHHFSMGKSFMSDKFVLNELSKRTKKYMFFETGEEHEDMFGNSLKGWNEQTIREFILSNTDFKEVITLGRDNDNVGTHINDYRRMLFVLKK